MEPPPNALAADQLLQQGDGEVGLPGADGPHEQKALVDLRPQVDELAHPGETPLERRVISIPELEAIERAVAVALRNASPLEKTRPSSALGACTLTYELTFTLTNELPAGVPTGQTALGFRILFRHARSITR